MKHTGEYTENPCPKNREIISDIIELGLLKKHMKGSMEVDVTRGRQLIKQYKEVSGTNISFTGWLVKCISESVKEHSQVHSLKLGRKKFITFKDIDVLITVEKTVNEDKFPLPFVIRKTNEKNLMDINGEIRSAQAAPVNKDTLVIGSSHLWLKYYLLLPKFIRRFIGKKMIMNPFFIKENVGTVGISAIGMKGNFNGWIMPVSPQPLYFSFGAITKKSGVIGDNVDIREYLNISFLFDHEVIDGAPMVRFLERLTHLIESGYALTALSDY